MRIFGGVYEKEKWHTCKNPHPTTAIIIDIRISMLYNDSVR